ncbi:carbohydrate ABC transporter permease [Paenibacillus agricola]|uniref:Sugar ABC transporter permease n=1 Tax=Paenibacillus agricola TaxID=2716264 RepID=A0ABX0JE55_9BACL|nr:sugar ABC transporter permease [Paenibacillus agricola]NHN32514.1 sugar ABC transporter permease [Paenibacillus agricola]
MIIQKLLKNHTVFMLMLVPAVVLYLIFVIYPMFGGMYYSLTNWTGMDANYKFIGLDNYQSIFTDPRVLVPLKNTFIYAFLTTVVVNIMALFIAVGLDSEIKSKNILRVLIYIPCILSSLIVGYVWSFIFTEPVAHLGKQLGIELLSNNILGSKASLFAVSFVTIWQTAGWYMVIYLAGLQTIDQNLYESAMVDGASRWQKFIYITVPSMVPAFTVNLVIALLRTFKQFDLIFAMTNGGPGNASEVVSLVIYKESFNSFHAGYGSAVGVLLFAIIVVFSLIQISIFRKAEDKASV